MALTNLSQITTSGISTLADINLNNITGVAATFTGNVTVGGTLTYDDVTNIDSVGLVTARSGVSITGGDLTLPDAIIHAGDTNTKIRFPAADTFSVETGGNERFRITSAGNTIISATSANPLNLYKYGTAAPTILMYGANGTAASPTQTLTGDVIGGLNMFGYGSSGFAGGPSVRINAVATENNGGTSNRGADIKIETVTTGGTSLGERLRITSDGKLGLGEAAPDFKFHSKETGGSTIAGLFETNQTDSYISFQASGTTASSTVRIGAIADNFVAFVNGGERLRITSTGWQQGHAAYAGVGINTFASWARTGGAVRAEVGYNAVTTDYMYFGTGTNHPLALRVNNTNALYIKNDASRSIGIGTDNPVGNLEIRDSKANLIVAKDGLTVKSNSNLHTTYDMLQIGAGGALASYSTATATADTQLVHNAYRHSGGTQKYRYADTATRLRMNTPGGSFRFESAASGSADADITFSEKVRINSAGNLGVGNDGSFPIYTGTNDRTLILGTGSEDSAIQIHSGTSNYGGLYFGDATSGSNRYRGYVEFKHGTSDDFLRFGTAAEERLRITSAGYMGLGTGSPRRHFHLHESSSATVGFQMTNAGTGESNDSQGFQLKVGSDGHAEIAQMENSNLRVFTNATERLRITSSGDVSISSNGTVHGPSKLTILPANRTSAFSASDGDTWHDVVLMQGGGATNNAVGIAFEIEDGGSYHKNAGTGICAVKNGTNSDFGSDLVFITRPQSAVAQERLRITSDGKVGINMSTPTVELDVNGRFRAKHGSSGLFFEEINNGAALWLDGANGDFSGGDYYGIIANNSARLQFGYAGAAHMELNTSGQLYLGSYPHDHTVAGGSHLKLRAGAGAWGISLGMRSTQNDYAYFGFTDMNGDENIGDIFMQRTGTSTGHMVFSTNNGTTSSINRMRIGTSGRLCVSPSANFTSESSSFVMTVVNNGNGNSGGYPGINIRSVATGGNTNSSPGMTLMASDSNWTLYTASGNVHGLGILAGNSANSNTCAMYIRSDKKVITGPTTVDELDTATSSGTAFCVTGGGLSVGSLGNQGDTVQGGRNVIGWYMYRYNGSSGYAHLTTSLWGGGSPSNNSEYMMGGFRIHGYRYSTAAVSEENIYFHNWSGSLANYSRYHWGNWDPGNTVYVNSSGYVTLRLSNGPYYGYDIDLIQHAWYAIRDIKVTNVTYNGNATI